MPYEVKTQAKLESANQNSALVFYLFEFSLSINNHYNC